jgi:putative hydrolase of the HAD superfamily
MIEFIYFDVGGTLIDPLPSVGAVYADAGRAHGLFASPEDLQAAFRKAWTSHTAPGAPSLFTMGHDEASTHAWWRAVVTDVLAEVGFEGDIEACYRSFFSAFEKRESWRVYDDVVPTLEALDRRGIRRGIISNWDYRLPPLLDALDLTRWFDPILVSAVERLAKPDVAFYRLAADRAGVAPEHILAVGDRIDLDVEPARAAGFQAVRIDRAADEPNSIRSLTSLLDRLR